MEQPNFIKEPGTSREWGRDSTLNLVASRTLVKVVGTTVRQACRGRR